MSALHEEVNLTLGPLESIELMLKFKQVTRDVRERGRDIEGCIKQWMSFVKPNFERYVEPQRKIAGKSLNQKVSSNKAKSTL